MIPKPIPRKTEKRRRKAAESAVIKSVRLEVMRRDSHLCRARYMREPCSGPLEWAHLGDNRRWKTRGMAPEKRHTTKGSLCLCKTHHALYDSGSRKTGERMSIMQRTDAGADGPLSFRFRDNIYEEQ